MSCPRCFTGHVNPGTPQGRWETVHGLRTYIAEPALGKDAAGIVVIVPDAFGADFINNQILADHYASAANFRVYLPDFMDGKAAPVRTMINMAHTWDNNESFLSKVYYGIATAFDFIPFLWSNRWAVSWPRVLDFLRKLQETNNHVLPVGIAGFCWGGLHAIKLSQDNPETRTTQGKPLADGFFTAHPSWVKVAEDIAGVSRNLSIAIGDDDSVMGIKEVREAEAILGTKPEVESEVVIYPGAKHGFSIRASRVNPDSHETRQAEEAEQQAIAWFKRQFEAARQKQGHPSV